MRLLNLIAGQPSRFGLRKTNTDGGRTDVLSRENL